MATTTIPKDKRLARMALVEEHVRLENEHDLEGVLGTFGKHARYDDEAWGEHYEGAAGVRQFYEQLMRALPDLEIDVQHRHVAEEVIVLEVMIRGTQLGAWRGQVTLEHSLEARLRDEREQRQAKEAAHKQQERQERIRARDCLHALDKLYTQAESVHDVELMADLLPHVREAETDYWCLAGLEERREL